MAEGPARSETSLGEADALISGLKSALDAMLCEAAERGRELEELRAGERRFHRLVEMQADPVWSFTVDPPVPVDLPAGEQAAALLERGRVAECNAACAQAHGYAGARELLGLPIAGLLADLSEGQRDVAARFVRSGFCLTDSETALRVRAGRNATFLTSLVGCVEDGRLTGGWVTQRDIAAPGDDAARRETEAKFRFLVDNASDIVCVVDANGTIQFGSPSAEQVLGYRPEDLVGTSAFAMVHPDDLARTRGGLGAALRNPGVPSPIVELRLRRADGSWCYLQAVGKGLVDASGRRTALIGLRDITEHKRVEDALRESQRALSTLLSNLPGMAYRCRNDRDWTMEFASQGCLTLTGYPPEDLLGNRRISYNEIVHPDDRDAIWQQVQAALEARRPFQLTYRIVSADGQTKWVWEQGRGVWAGGGPLTALEGFITDITERKQAEQRLAFLAAAVEQSADAIVVTGMDGAIRYVNPAFERTTGYTPAEAVGRKVGSLLSADPDDAVHEEVWAALRERGTWQGRFTNRAKDGRPILQDASISAIRDAAGRIEGFVAAQRDVTHQVEMEAHAAEAEKLEAIGTLAGGIAHDFNNLLSAILGYTQMALMKTAEDSPVRHDLQAILQGSQRAADLVKQILAFSRQGCREEKPVRVDLVVKEALRFLRATVPSTIEIRSEIHSDAAALADPTEIHRLIVNLCTNAAIAMRDRGGVLTVAVADACAGAAQADGVLEPRLRLTVRDTGCGMSREVMAHIFEPFFTTRHQGGGTGMGLAVVHGIVKRSGGTITVESEPGEGTAFEVCLPCVEQEAPAATATPEQMAGGTERVIFVDDELLVGDLAVGMLGGLGYRVRAFTDGADALTAFAADPGAVDLVITDMTMPGLTGDTLATEVKRRRPDLPVILCTGYSEKLTSDAVRALGVDAFVMKPVSPAQLSKLIREVLDRG